MTFVYGTLIAAGALAAGVVVTLALVYGLTILYTIARDIWGS